MTGSSPNSAHDPGGASGLSERNADQPSRYSRREALGWAAASGAALAVAPVLASCGGSSSSSGTTTAASAPKRGGQLTVGILGGSSTDTLDDRITSFVDNARVGNLYDPLANINRDAVYELTLAEEITPNADASSWLIRLKPGVEFHNGKPLTSADVKFTLQRDVRETLDASYLLSMADVENIKILDKTSLMVPMKTPCAIFDQICASPWELQIFPEGFDPKAPIGTGPFKFQSFTPGQQSVFVRNENYWQDGLPYLDELIIVDAGDETAQAAGIMGGQFDAIDQVQPGAVSGLTSAGIKTVISHAYSWNPITMRVDAPPFNDVRVRQAFRLIIDRPQALNLAVGGYGSIANDLFSPFDPTYNHSLPQRHQDIEQAKFLLKAAGHDSLTVTMQTSNQIGVGIYQTAQIFQQQATLVGVTVNLQTLTQTAFYGPNYTKYPFASDDWSIFFYLLQVLESMLPTSQVNETHFDNPTYNKLAAAAFKELDLTKRTELVHAMQTIEYNEGGYIIPFFTGFVDAIRPNVEGLEPYKVGLPFNDYQFKYLWKT